METLVSCSLAIFAALLATPVTIFCLEIIAAIALPVAPQPSPQSDRVVAAPQPTEIAPARTVTKSPVPAATAAKTVRGIAPSELEFR